MNTNCSNRKVRKLRGFSLVEVMIASSISLLVVSAVSSMGLHFSKTSLAMSAHDEIEIQTQRLFQYFEKDVRSASAVVWTDTQNVDLTVNGLTVSYSFDPLASEVSRTETGSASRVLADGLSSASFRAFDISGTEVSITGNTAAASLNTRMIQFSGALTRTVTSSKQVSVNVETSRYMLRN